MIISAHVLVKNEGRFLWYSVMSIIDYVDRIRIWDTGSTDSTLKIIDEIKNHPKAKGKIFFNQEILNDFHESNTRNKMISSDFSEVRQHMLDVTIADWFLIVDADEIWWESSIKKVTSEIRKNGHNYESVVVPTINLVGDLYHFQEDKAGRYHLAGKVGHYNLRGLKRSIPGLKAQGEHGVFGWTDNNGTLIENRDKSKILFCDTPYLHATHLRRSDHLDSEKKVLKRSKKLKHELGTNFPLDFYYPEVFFRERPSVVPSVWDKPDYLFRFRSFFETPLRKLYRRTLLPYIKHGY